MELLDEAKTCYLTKQYNAAVALGRMMLEQAVVNVGVRLGLYQSELAEDYYKNYPPSACADLVLGKKSDNWKRFKKLYHEGSMVIHSSPGRGDLDVASYLEEVILLIGDIYTVCHRSLQSSG